MNFQMIARPLLAAAALLLLFSCGGGGGGSPAPQAANPTPVSQPPDDQTGVVGILIKDAPSDDYTRIMMRISRVALIPTDDDDGHVVVFDGDKEFDLLQLQNFYDMLAISENVPVGEYEKIRLRVTSITVYYLDENDEEQSQPVEVPANGKVDLNPQGSFTVAPGTAILIGIDIDAKKSIHMISTGNGSERHKFRPVVFVEIIERQALEGLVRLDGRIEHLFEDNSSLELCDIETQLDSASGEDCLIVNTFGDTQFFDAQGDRIEDGFDGLDLDQMITVFGLVVIVDEVDDGDSDSDSDSDGDSDSDSNGSGDSDSDTDSDLDSDGDSDSDTDDTVRMVQIDAVVIQRADPEDVLLLDGRFLTAVDTDNDTFGFDVAEGEDFPEDTVSVLLQGTTVILSADGLMALEPGDIQPDLFGQVAGIIRDGEELLRSSLVVIELESEPRDRLDGTVTEAPTDSLGEFTIGVGDPAVERCVAPTSEAAYYRVTSSPETLLIEEVNSGAVGNGSNVTVFGSDPGEPGCFEAETITILVIEEVTTT